MIDYKKDYMKRRDNPILIDESVAKTIFTDKQIKAAKDNEGILSAKYQLNQGQV